ncbi:hypothetical protein QQ045_001244 [Rhodiola kirilowii]
MLNSHIISKHLKYVIPHGLEGVLVVERSEFDLLSLVRSEHLPTLISSLQIEVTFRIPSFDFLPPWVLDMSEIKQGNEQLWFDTPFSYLNSTCNSTVCENDLVAVFLIFVAKGVFVGSWCSFQLFVAIALSIEPPGKPPDDSLKMSEQLSQGLSLTDLVPLDMFCLMFSLIGSWQNGFTGRQTLASNGRSISVYIIELDRPHIALTMLGKRDVRILWDSVILVVFDEKYATHIVVRLNMGNNNLIRIKQFFSAGKTTGLMEAANVLQHMLYKDQLRCTDALILGEFQQYVEKDAAIGKRSYIAEPSITDTIQIFRGLGVKYDSHQDDKALVMAALLLVQYIVSLYLPDKATDFGDEVCANVEVHALASAQMALGDRELQSLLKKFHLDKFDTIGHAADAAFSPFHNRFATASADEAAKLWATESTFLISFEGNIYLLPHIASHPPGKYLTATSFAKTWCSCNVYSSADLLPQECLTMSVYGIVLHHYGSLLTSSLLDALARVWDLQTRRRIPAFEGHDKHVLALSFSPYVYHLATDGEENSCQILNLRMHRKVKVTAAHSYLISQVQYETQEEYFLMKSSHTMASKVWSTRNNDMMLYVVHLPHGDEALQMMQQLVLQVVFVRKFVWNSIVFIFTWNNRVLLFSLPRPPEVSDLEGKVAFERGSNVTEYEIHESERDAEMCANEGTTAPSTDKGATMGTNAPGDRATEGARRSKRPVARSRRYPQATRGKLTCPEQQADPTKYNPHTSRRQPSHKVSVMHSGHSENEEPSEYDGVVSSKVLSSASNVVINDTIETVNVSQEADPWIGRALQERQQMVLINTSDSYYILDNKVAAIGVNGERSVVRFDFVLSAAL